jgi:hypothetical protein
MMGKPVGRLSEKLRSMRTSGGKPVKYEMGLVLARDFAPGTLQTYRDFWKTIALKSGMPYMDLVEDFLAFGPAYFPLAEQEGRGHYFASGINLYACLVAHELIQRKLIPFSAQAPQP